jgi:hypothetical protein
MKNEYRAPLRFLAVLAVALLAACGGETKTGSTGTGSVPTEREDALVAGALVSIEPFSIGVAEIATATASIRKDENPDAGAEALRLGMNVEGAGTVMGLFEAVPVVLRAGGTQSAVRGAVSSVNAAAHRFTVATLTFLVDGSTLYDSVAGIAALTPGAYVEVWGLPLADTRTVLATRVTQIPPDNGRISIAARIDAFTPEGLSLAGITVPGASSGNFNPVPPTGSLIRVSGNYNPASNTITNELVSPLPEFAPAIGTRVEIEGIALDVVPSGGFLLRTPARDYDVAPGVSAPAPVTAETRVHVVATATAPSSLTATSMLVVAGQIVYRVTGAVSEFSSLASLRVRGEPVDLTTAVIRGGNASDIVNGRRIAIVGTAGSGALRVSEATLQP